MKAVAGVTRDESGRGTLRLKNSSETPPVSLSYMTLFKSMQGRAECTRSRENSRNLRGVYSWSHLARRN